MINHMTIRLPAFKANEKAIDAITGLTVVIKQTRKTQAGTWEYHIQLARYERTPFWRAEHNLLKRKQQ